MVKWIHIADVHLGASPDAGDAYSKVRPQELWDTFAEVIDICEREQTDLLLIAGCLHILPLNNSPFLAYIWLTFINVIDSSPAFMGMRSDLF